MKITIENTTKMVTANGVQCRVWEGHSESGVRVTCLIARIATPNEADGVIEFERELKEQRAPSADVDIWPLRIVL